ncbi:GNAT family N-acetyltransferase [Brevundimonas sp. FT23042]|uniref:GNAT family N-acetyltransferase n=1 Tax=Brevundimonas sp. FT23042 TaxID=3393749 RepID=UPI003B5887CE
MTGPSADRLAALHAAAFDSPWDAAAFAALLDQPGVFAIEREAGFILMRAVADEAEILTLAVTPASRRSGEGTRLVADGVAAASLAGADRVFLEVAEDNAAARALYARTGFTDAGRRPRYYSRSDGSRVDALLLALNLPGRLP